MAEPYSISSLLEKAQTLLWGEKPKVSEEFTFPVASGVIAGGSLVGVAIVFWENGWEMVRQVLQQLTGQ